MAIDAKDLKEIASKLKVGDHLNLVDRLNENDKNSVTIKAGSFDKEILKSTNWADLIRAIYSNNSQFSNGEYVVALASGKKDVFTVINSKKPKEPSFNVTVFVTNHTLVIKDLKGSMVTYIEHASVVKSKKESETKTPFYQTLIDRLKAEKPSPEETMKIIEELQTAKKV